MPANLSPQADLLFASYFEREILPVLTPIALDSAHPAPKLRDGSVHLAVRFRQREGRGARYGLVLVHPALPKEIRLPFGGGEIAMHLIQLIARHLSTLFQAAIEECWVVRDGLQSFAIAADFG